MHRHYLLYKPFGYLSQFVYEKKRPKKLLGSLGTFAPGTMAIGRLDEDSEGLLLLTTDGKMSEQVRSAMVEKEYFVLVDGVVSAQAVQQLEQGVLIGVKGTKYQTRPCKVRMLETPPEVPYRKVRDLRHGPQQWISVALREGKFRQIRKMTAAVGHPTLRLIRVRVGNIALGDMQPGEIREVNDFDYL